MKARTGRARWCRAFGAAVLFHGFLALGAAALLPSWLSMPTPPVIEVELVGESSGGGRGGESSPSGAASFDDAFPILRGGEEGALREAVADAGSTAAGGAAPGTGEGTGSGTGTGSGAGEGDGTGAGHGSGEEEGPVEGPQLLSAVQPQYPEGARRDSVEGTTVVGLVISAEGAVTSAWVEETSGDSRLDEAAVVAVYGWRFVPARQGGAAVASRSRVPVVFQLRG